ncbi:MAG: hypothetical protein WCX71_05070 [Candidatus Buchananbacteria bacterium]
MKLHQAILMLDGEQITSGDLAQYKDESAGHRMRPEVFAKISDRDALLAILSEEAPLTVLGQSPGSIIADDDNAAVLEARMQRFEYSINGVPGFTAFGVHLTPLSGRVQMVSVHDDITIKGFMANPGQILMDLGDDRLRLVIYFGSQEQPTGIQPPAGYRPTRQIAK